MRIASQKRNLETRFRTPKDKALAKTLIYAGIDLQKNGTDYWQRAFHHPDVTSLLHLAGIADSAKVPPGRSNQNHVQAEESSQSQVKAVRQVDRVKLS